MAVVAVFAMSLVLTTPLLRAMLRDAPQSMETVNSHHVMLRMLRYLRDDVDRARSLPEKSGELTANDRRLLITQREQTVCYELSDDTVTRRVLGAGEESESVRARQWQIPRAKIEWTVRRKRGKGYAVEVRTAVLGDVQGQSVEKLANVHVFFAGAADARGATK